MNNSHAKPCTFAIKGCLDNQWETEHIFMDGIRDLDDAIEIHKNFRHQLGPRWAVGLYYEEARSTDEMRYFRAFGMRLEGERMQRADLERRDAFANRDDPAHWTSATGKPDYVAIQTLASHDDVDPVAQFDQARAEDIELLRRARGYFMVVVVDDADGKGSVGYLHRVRGVLTDLEMEKVTVAAAQAAKQTMSELRRDQLDRARGVGDEAAQHLQDHDAIMDELADDAVTREREREVADPELPPTGAAQDEAIEKYVEGFVADTLSDTTDESAESPDEKDGTDDEHS